MSRQIQIRRGTVVQHKSFIGAEGELTMDTTNKMLRLHDGFTPGGIALSRADDLDLLAEKLKSMDVIIEMRTPANDSNGAWYRRYQSGWVEQGGRGAFSNIITMPIEMAANYQVVITPTDNIGGTGIWTEQRTANSFRCIGQNYGGQFLTSAKHFYWIVCGMAA